MYTFPQQLSTHLPAPVDNDNADAEYYLWSLCNTGAAQHVGISLPHPLMILNGVIDNIKIGLMITSVLHSHKRGL